ncbi:MAG TPA: hypothetical protein VH062_07265 [Polyangiaceae bacterium]|jgi:hypothetical protein|nr:hypothetical protein [Polyangiaceae bacterium]
MPDVAELDCVEVHEALLAGRPLSPAEAQHAASCPICSEGLPSGDAFLPSAELLNAIESDVRRETGVVAKLRALPTARRVLIGIVATMVFAVGTALVRPRWSFGPMPEERVGLVLAVLGVLITLMVWLGLRPLQAAPLGRRALLASVTASLLVPVLFAATPPGAESSALGDPGMVKGIMSCFLFGALPGVLFVLALRVLDRNAHHAASAALLAAAGGGLAGNLALEMHCPSVAPLHLLLGHATVGVVLVLTYRALRPSPGGVSREISPD